MLPCRSDESRRKNQFSKDERLHLLNIMGQYGPLLDDKSASLFGRREIWRAIERDFHQAGFTSKTSAQLKKYWQNYKYHGRRAQTVNQTRLSFPRSVVISSLRLFATSPAGAALFLSSLSSTFLFLHVDAYFRLWKWMRVNLRGMRKCARETMERTPALPEDNRDNLETKIAGKSACVSPSPVPPSAAADASLQNLESGCRQRQIYGDNGTFFRKLSATPILPTDSETPDKNRSNSEISQRKSFSSTEVIVSNTDVSDNSVTVSVICPERSPRQFPSKNQLKRKRDVPPDRTSSSFSSTVSVASAASPGKKDAGDHSIFPAAGKGRCFLLQPRQSDNRGEVISDRRNTAETRRKLEPAKKDSPAVLSSRFASQSETPESTRGIAHESGEYLPRQDPAACHARDIQDSPCDKGRREELKIRSEAATSRNQRDDSADMSDVRLGSLGDAASWHRNTIDPVQSGLRDELNYRLMLHRLETEEKRLKVKIAEMAIQEIRFRIRALNEDIRRADELHELHLALATAQADTEELRV
ncbi:uncharacterized protein LOC116845639 [Odontomachus brunneus]|uniref:uncharacterized protein LOC116845639 n=1 Tax=Odontomachus brunneus TaxID=486640 RepID=UPI0013F22E5F|nr:uncharacterized protein LOC116845639 [Odontomachus brunneus]